MWLKIYEEILWMHPFTGAIWKKMQKRLIQRWGHTESIERAIIFRQCEQEHWRPRGVDLQKNNYGKLGKTPKLFVWQKNNNLLQTNRLQKEIRKKVDLKLTHAQRKGILSKNDLKLRRRFFGKVRRKFLFWIGL